MSENGGRHWPFRHRPARGDGRSRSRAAGGQSKATDGALLAGAGQVASVNALESAAVKTRRTGGWSTAGSHRRDISRAMLGLAREAVQRVAPAGRRPGRRRYTGVTRRLPACTHQPKPLRAGLRAAAVATCVHRGPVGDCAARSQRNAGEAADHVFWVVIYSQSRQQIRQGLHHIDSAVRCPSGRCAHLSTPSGPARYTLETPAASGRRQPVPGARIGAADHGNVGRNGTAVFPTVPASPFPADRLDAAGRRLVAKVARMLCSARWTQRQATANSGGRAPVRARW